MAARNSGQVVFLTAAQRMENILNVAETYVIAGEVQSAYDRVQSSVDCDVPENLFQKFDVS